ncbi:MAG: aromatic ring-hydroxylating dioxygenase subunit alpha [Alphaproteobacteria bacterium]|nr:aromatic ring-hydroxylating dioxygenase subunit alpha [Alphaproteobacteria bacterium]
MDGQSRINAMLAARRPGFSLEQAFYTDPEIFRLDLETIFYRDWLFAGHGCEIPKPGDYFLHEVGDYSVIVIRSADGAIRALHNTCRHRGSRLCREERGSKRKLVCPYHQWAYDTDGALVAARQMGDKIDLAQYGLKTAHCAEVGGYIFVCVADAAPDFAACRDQLAPYMDPHRLDDAKVAFESTIVEEGNWKLVWENNRECYHCRGSHPELCRTWSDSPVLNGARTDEAGATNMAHWARCEAAGLASRFKLHASGQFRTARQPLTGEAESFTMSGKRAVAKPLGDIGERQIGSMLLFHYPSSWNHLLVDHAISFKVIPLGPRRTKLTTKWLVNKDAVEDVDYDLKTLTEVWLATNDEDRTLVEQNQRGINSPAYTPGPYAPADENGVVQFVDWYSTLMERRLDGQRRRAVA